MLFAMKIVAVLFVLCGLSEAGQPIGSRGHRQELLNEVCVNAADKIVCEASALRCFFKSTPKNVKEAFCQCLSETAGVQALYTQWVQDGGRDKCTTGGSHAAGGSNKGHFYQYLRNHTATEADLFECCIGTKQNLFTATGAPNVVAWKENAGTTADATAEINAAIDHCSTNADNGCSAKSFMTCILQQCINKPA